jgi:hypothetical protein
MISLIVLSCDLEDIFARLEYSQEKSNTCYYNTYDKSCPDKASKRPSYIFPTINAKFCGILP